MAITVDLVISFFTPASGDKKIGGNDCRYLLLEQERDIEKIRGKRDREREI